MIGTIFGIWAYVTLALSLRVIVWNPRKRRLMSMQLLRRMCRFLLKILNIHVTFEGPEWQSFTGSERLLLLPNHISYLDVIIMQAFIPTVFVTSREIEETPGLGEITRAAGCMYVERRHKWYVRRDINQLACMLDDGFNVTVFPEGTTTNGEALLPFKSTLIESALRSGARVLPICLRYERADGSRLSEDECSYVAWWGDQKFFPHLKRLMLPKSLHVRLSVLGPIPVRQNPCRKKITAHAKDLIEAKYRAR